jgi:hypothetical protein
MNDEQSDSETAASRLAEVQAYADANCQDLAWQVLVYEFMVSRNPEAALIAGSKLEMLVRMATALRQSPVRFEIIKLFVINACLTRARELITTRRSSEGGDHAEA